MYVNNESLNVRAWLVCVRIQQISLTRVCMVRVRLSCCVFLCVYVLPLVFVFVTFLYRAICRIYCQRPHNRVYCQRPHNRAASLIRLCLCVFVVGHF